GLKFLVRVNAHGRGKNFSRLSFELHIDGCAHGNAENCPGDLKERLGPHGKIRLDLLTAGNRERRGRLQIRHARIESRSKPAQAGGTPRKGRERTGKIRSGHEQVLSRHQVRHSKLTILVRADLTSQVPALAAFDNVLLENANGGVFDGFSLRAYDVTNNRAL